MLSLATHQFLVGHAMGLIGVGSFPPAKIGDVFFEIPLGADHVAVLLGSRT